MIRTKKTFLTFTLYFVFMSLFIACSSDDDDIDEDATVGEIMTLNADGERVAGSTVRLDCESSINQPCDVEFTGLTDEQGIFRREFQLPKVLRVRAHKIVIDTTVEGTLPDTNQIITRDSICGETYISIIESQVSRQTVVLFSCD